MIRYLLAAALLAAPAAARAQPPAREHAPGMHDTMPRRQTMPGHQTTPGHRATPAKPGTTPRAARPTEPGQGAFAAIQEIVALLLADPKTDWSTVDIERLRRHLVDMNNVTLHARAAAAPIPNGMRFTVTGTGAVRGSIRRMVTQHARVMDGAMGWRYAAEPRPDGAVLSVTVADAKDLPKLKALGFIGVMALGMHHQAHHLMMATGRGPHR